MHLTSDAARLAIPFPPDVEMMGTLLRSRRGFLTALGFSIGFHASLLLPWWGPPEVPVPEETLQVRLRPESEGKPQPSKPRQAKPPNHTKPQIVSESPPLPSSIKVPASMPAPPTPGAEEWQLASTYTLRNSKRYRYTWGQQIRSMMGTSVEGPGQGVVRFRIEIAPDGKIAKVEELWSTSKVASKLALRAIQNLPSLPPTPTGKPLIFEQTISFLPYETGWPPSYKLDCLPEPLPFSNPFAWDGSSPSNGAKREHRPPPPEGCPPDSTEATIEEEEKSFERQMEQWRLWR